MEMAKHKNGTVSIRKTKGGKIEKKNVKEHNRRERECKRKKRGNGR